MSTQLKSRPTIAFSPTTRPTGAGHQAATPERAPFWLTDQLLSIQERNRALAQYSRSSRSLMGM